MKIVNITTDTITIPLNTTFTTALRSIDSLDNVIVTVTTDTGLKGFGSAAPAPVITGETVSSIIGAIEVIAQVISGMEIEDSETVFQHLNSCLIGNNSAKAAVDMAIYDLLAKSFKVPLYKLLGGSVPEVETDITISLGTFTKMVRETEQRLEQGFQIFKIKVGGNPHEDLERIAAIAGVVGSEGRLRLDANQGWKPKEAVYVASELEKWNISVELMEQPVAAGDFKGLCFVRDNINLPVYADESVFSPQDALKLVKTSAVDGLNIKLMKCGGIYNALKIAAIAETAGLPCMIGSMMECHISVTAAAHLAAAKNVICCYDLDAPLFCSRNPARGGLQYEGPKVWLPEAPGLGISEVVV